MSKVYSAIYSQTPVYEMTVDGTLMMRRIHDSFCNATQLLKIAGLPKSQRMKILDNESQIGRHQKIRGGYSKFQGTWVSLDSARALAQRFGVMHILAPILFLDNQKDAQVKPGTSVKYLQYVLDGVPVPNSVMQRTVSPPPQKVRHSPYSPPKILPLSPVESTKYMDSAYYSAYPKGLVPNAPKTVTMDNQQMYIPPADYQFNFQPVNKQYPLTPEFYQPFNEFPEYNLDNLIQSLEIPFNQEPQKPLEFTYM
ncbi:transcriptional regulator swi6 [Boothiomyces sp. JEL0838]|nr:transcriptional regulator swi6 [Boothiomyces sp. JEL0838]